ncbi:hypothetical protein PP175_05615 [Aneurinibacillus sp. Ricciae_BoGa-3]|uniref:hypothetical protein n=1 Tax=Aneurinibacillus sp. Ricciae_BoGa-3 TaxID=3022697 RepID=UPI00233FACAD|nr:hypothetical protein [Aneurinibacillus sp. Ricciae_BoGa-3]WCK55428.1 hypothetical protein PP175_05615 [Aneurinibacillus sp. Ricciae_BoGa-3]
MDLVTLVYDYLKLDPTFVEIIDWNKANGFISLEDSGISVGINRERYESGSRDYDYCTSIMSIVCWIREEDQATGENMIRELAHNIRLSLSEDEGRTLNGQVIGGFVSGIEYLSTKAEDTLMLHIAEITYEVEYQEDRMRPQQASTVLSISNDIDIER